MNENVPINERPVSAARRTDVALWGGVALVVIGCMALLDNFGLHLHIGLNWWALFMAVPGVLILKRVYDAYQASGQLTRSTRSQLIAGGLLVLMAVFFLFNLSMGVLWPLLLIVGGVAVLAGTASRQA